uniref:Uncharacterized protein n=1 Tax=Acrobeloides nanus TaxID=290746 RepID=A0A914BYL3_9BILA
MENDKDRLGYLLARKQELIIRKGLATNIAEELVKKTNGYRSEVKELKKQNKSLTEKRELAQKLYDVAGARVNSLNLSVKQCQMRLDKYKKMVEFERSKKKELEQKNRDSKQFKEKMRVFLTDFKKAPWIPEREKLAKRLEDERRNLNRIVDSLEKERKLINEKEAILKGNEELPFQKFCVQAATLALKQQVLMKKLAMEVAKYNNRKDMLNDSVLDVSISHTDDLQNNAREETQEDYEDEEMESGIPDDSEIHDTEMETSEVQEMESQENELMESQENESQDQMDSSLGFTINANPEQLDNSHEVANQNQETTKHRQNVIPEPAQEMPKQRQQMFNINPAPVVNSQEVGKQRQEVAKQHHRQSVMTSSPLPATNAHEVAKQQRQNMLNVNPVPAGNAQLSKQKNFDNGSDFLTAFGENSSIITGSEAPGFNMSLASQGQGDFLAAFGGNVSITGGSEAQGGGGDFFSFFGDGGSGQVAQSQADDFGFNFNLEMSEQDEPASGGFSFNF